MIKVTSIGSTITRFSRKSVPAAINGFIVIASTGGYAVATALFTTYSVIGMVIRVMAMLMMFNVMVMMVMCMTMALVMRTMGLVLVLVEVVLVMMIQMAVLHVNCTGNDLTECILRI